MKKPDICVNGSRVLDYFNASPGYWNRFVERNKGKIIEIDGEGFFDFPDIDFSDYNPPEGGGLIFKNISFRNKSSDFTGSLFFEEEITFFKCLFDNARFSNIKFLSDVNFFECSFVGNSAVFNESEFLGHLRFWEDVSFSVSRLDFSFSSFKSISFKGVDLRDHAGFSFLSSRFENGGVEFIRCSMESKILSFNKCDINANGIFFDDCELRLDSLDLSEVNGGFQIGLDRVNFYSCNFNLSRCSFYKCDGFDSKPSLFLKKVCFDDSDFCFNSVLFESNVEINELCLESSSFEMFDSVLKGISIFDGRFKDYMINLSETKVMDGSLWLSKIRAEKGHFNISMCKFVHSGLALENGDLEETVFGVHKNRFEGAFVLFDRSSIDKDFTFIGNYMKSSTVNSKHSASVGFHDCRFGGDFFKCTASSLGDSATFEGSIFSGAFLAEELDDVDSLSVFNLRHCQFGGTVSLAGNEFKCVPDLTNTKLSNQVSLDRIDCSPDVVDDPDPEDAVRLCRLKEIAESNKNHELALRFHILEMRIKKKSQSVFYRWLHSILDVVSEYGWSVAKPLFCLVISTVFFTLIYSVSSANAKKINDLTWSTILDGFTYSLTQVLPFVPIGREAAKEFSNRLFPIGMPDWMFGVSLLQGVISFALLFLIGLGLRNRFRF